MIEGNLSDVSLPGLLQFLATESNKSFRVKLVSGAQRGEIFISEGEILAANYGLLEGNDALTEFLFWVDGTFVVERLASRLKDTVNVNLRIILKQINTFADQMLFLQESGVGLNTELVPSVRFGTQEWQEALQKQPLYKEDFAVIGWIPDGRSMRQAMREFNFDVIKATSSLFRLVFTGSVETVRPSVTFSVTDTADNLEPAELQLPADDATADSAGSGAPASADDSYIFKGNGKRSGKDEIPAAQPAQEAKKSSVPQFVTEDSQPAAGTPAFKDLVAKGQPTANMSTETSDSIPALPATAFPAAAAASAASAPAPSQVNIFNSSQAAPKPFAPPTSVPPAHQKFEAKAEPKEEEKIFAVRRTDPLPLVAIDIERLFQTSFKVTPFGQMALSNEALDGELRQIIGDFKKGKTFINVAVEGSQLPAQVLYSVKYSLERGYIEPPDQVVSLTADLLLGRVELEQYLLQRRRLTGDELRDVIDLSRQKGIKLVELLVKMGFMTESDWFRLSQEKERFAPR
jgi:hypothetical protein